MRRRRNARTARPSGVGCVALFVALSVIAGTAEVDAQHQRKDEEAGRSIPDPRDPAAVGFQYDPRELHPRSRGGEPVRIRIIGPIGIGGFHVYPGQATGPNEGPPRTLWGQGFGVSLWRDPITGWPLQ